MVRRRRRKGLIIQIFEEAQKTYLTGNARTPPAGPNMSDQGGGTFFTSFRILGWGVWGPQLPSATYRFPQQALKEPTPTKCSL